MFRSSSFRGPPYPHPCGNLGRRLAARRHCGQAGFPVLGNRSPPMHAPERWPYGEIESWWAWRDHLDRIQDPNIATLKREADCEIADPALLRVAVGAEAARAAGAG